ncbi:LysR family transcriptional regulator [Aestuariirhabdus litorea]|uniref:LysR family transcriptional regulator n=1 Tax=Aestuariirhabdus litorea TaxID=2528527 RepID=A0A3P3VKL3_9GAMM|nr:LysR family transcriptional regulator [Aestuariirhabdus litorea]RRJ82276.1 LysR family transcriptional regulator [Aestuariirhabdus litorea]RWW92442.1 LysR family transcriptional regulator [Endozoicomonadaceae bacterium GTF-13]
MKTKPSRFKGQVSDVDLRMLRIFRKVVECGGFSAAEVELNISRAAISIAMADLETRLGLRLCQRGRSGFSLTDEGSRVYDYSLQLLSALEDFRTQVNALHAQLKGELNIGITDNLVTMPHMRITNALKALKGQGAEVNYHIRMSPPNEIELGVLEGRLHLGVVPELKPLSGLEYRSLYEEQSLLYCSSNHPLFRVPEGQLTEAMIRGQEAVVPSYAQSPEIRSRYQPFKASATATDREGVAFLILSDCYIGYLPSHFAQRWVSEGRMQVLLPERYHYNTRFAAITRKGGRANLVLDTFLKILEST